MSWPLKGSGSIGGIGCHLEGAELSASESDFGSRQLSNCLSDITADTGLCWGLAPHSASLRNLV